ncbi:MAG: hypothetical protein ISS34_04680 [Candidatus Omnitrophica bacterium]|nr:hypothetical protein [Candidatus Omnitrophota bacterium]
MKKTESIKKLLQRTRRWTGGVILILFYAGLFFKIPKMIIKRQEGIGTFALYYLRLILTMPWIFIKTILGIVSVEPIFANNKMPPYNYICGVAITRGDEKHILFSHSDCRRKYKGAEKIKGAHFTILKFNDNELEKIMYIDKNINSIC